MLYNIDLTDELQENSPKVLSNARIGRLMAGEGWIPGTAYITRPDYFILKVSTDQCQLIFEWSIHF